MTEWSYSTFKAFIATFFTSEIQENSMWLIKCSLLHVYDIRTLLKLSCCSTAHARMTKCRSATSNLTGVKRCLHGNFRVINISEFENTYIL